MNRHLASIGILFLFIALHPAGSFLMAQTGLPENWYLLDPETTGYNSIGVEKVYRDLASGKKSQPVVVAVLDTGVDINHEDLTDVIWVNTDEVPGNGIDDDGNGYVDDVRGWNFIGSGDGTNIVKETLEVTRLYGKLRERFDGVDVSKLNKREKKRYAEYQSYKKVVERKRKSAEKQVAEIEEREAWINELLQSVIDVAGDTTISEQLVYNLRTKDDDILDVAANLLEGILKQKVDELSVSELMNLVREDFRTVRQNYLDDLHYTYNPDFNSREVIGDSDNDPEDRYYGNPTVAGDFAFHGTHVAGIIGAMRGNELGIDGIVRNARIMPVRVVPDGDEHDKDVANAIRYAVDNGADVINMSFGKGQSWDKKAVDKAVKYAMKHDVLLIHSAGNSGRENLGDNNFPNPFFEHKCMFGKKRADNWIEVGAASYQPGEKAVAGFSNYSHDQVDLFAPGVAIYSTAPNDSYAYAQGTSMSAPVVAGAAALLRSYFPSLKAAQVKDILMASVRPFQGKVIKPGGTKRVDPSELCIAGGMLDAYAAFQLASETKGKKKIKKTGSLRS